jgi:hypothetical protein
MQDQAAGGTDTPPAESEGYDPRTIIDEIIEIANEEAKKADDQARWEEQHDNIIGARVCRARSRMATRIAERMKMYKLEWF